MAEVYFTPGRVGVSWEIVVELAKAGSRSLMIRLARPTLTEVPLAGLSAVPPEQRPTEIEHASVIRSRPQLPADHPGLPYQIGLVLVSHWNVTL